MHLGRRCDGQKIWAQAPAGERGDFELHTHLQPREASYRSYVLRLVGLEPQPVSTATIAAEDYVVTLTVATE